MLLHRAWRGSPLPAASHPLLPSQVCLASSCTTAGPGSVHSLSGLQESQQIVIPASGLCKLCAPIELPSCYTICISLQQLLKSLAGVVSCMSCSDMIYWPVADAIWSSRLPAGVLTPVKCTQCADNARLTYQWHAGRKRSPTPPLAAGKGAAKRKADGEAQPAAKRQRSATPMSQVPSSPASTLPNLWHCPAHPCHLILTKTGRHTCFVCD